MGIHIHASPASGRHGFIAEVTTDINDYVGEWQVHHTTCHLVTVRVMPESLRG